jgi:hypothetical protein
MKFVEIRQDDATTIARVYDSMVRRCHACIRAQGEHFEQPLWAIFFCHSHLCF